MLVSHFQTTGKYDTYHKINEKYVFEVPKSISLRGAVGAPQWNTIRILVNQLRFVPQEAGSTNIAEYF